MQASLNNSPQIFLTFLSLLERNESVMTCTIPCTTLKSSEENVDKRYAKVRSY